MKQVIQKIRQLVSMAKASPTQRELWRLSSLPRHLATTTDLPGVCWRIPDGASFAASWEEIFGREIYKFVPAEKSARILDCGANVGVSSLYFYRNYPGASITAFEPDPEVFAYLKENLAAAGASGIELLQQAVWSVDTKLKFNCEGADSGRIEPGVGGRFIEVAAVRLRKFLEVPVDFLKLDIEGAETEVLRDIAPMLGNVRNLFVEYHSFAGQKQTLGEAVQLLVDAGFRVHLHPVNIAANPFVGTPSHLGMDMQLNIFARREPQLV